MLEEAGITLENAGEGEPSGNDNGFEIVDTNGDGNGKWDIEEVSFHL